MFEGIDFSELRLGEVGLLLDPLMAKAQEARASHFLMSLGMRIPVKRIPCDTPAAQGIAVMRRPLLSGREAFVCAPAYGYEKNEYLQSAVRFMLNTLRRIDEDAPERFEVYIAPVTIISDDEEIQAAPMPKASRNPRTISAIKVSFNREVDDDLSPSFGSCSDKALLSNDLTDDYFADESLARDAEEARREMVDRIASIVLHYVTRFHTMPAMYELERAVRGKIVLRKEGYSPLVVNGDLQVVLPDYNEMELKLTPLPRAVYLLFLLHPEGIVLKNIADYQQELEQIYALIMPGREEGIARASIAELTVPGSPLLQQKISVVNRVIRSRLINRELSACYLIKGKRGQPYKVALPQEMVSLPAALRF